MKVFVTTVLALLALVVSINVITFSLMTRPDNAAIVQLMAGWGRSYKPILYDMVMPEVAVFGKSITRDAFDPAEIEKLTGLRTFNFAVSGGTPYENRRFAQSAAVNDQLKAVILNLDSFERKIGSLETEYGFDESILNTTPNGQPNSGVGIHRLYATTLAGSATGYNLSLLLALARAAGGLSKEEILPAYERRDGAQVAARAVSVRRQIFPERPPADPVAAITLPAEIDRERLHELEIVLDTYCDRDIDVFVYTTPDAAGNCNISADRRLEALMLLKEKQGQCRARNHFFDFQYPNAVSLEGVMGPVTASEYYRPDGHPRPTVGTLMAAVMFDRPFPEGTPDSVRADFGTDLMAEPDPLAWLARRLARCEGHWVAEDVRVIMGDGTQVSDPAIAPLRELVQPAGLEPATYGSTIRRSTN